MPNLSNRDSSEVGTRCPTTTDDRRHKFISRHSGQIMAGSSTMGDNLHPRIQLGSNTSKDHLALPLHVYADLV